MWIERPTGDAAVRFWMTMRNLVLLNDRHWIYGGFHLFRDCPCFNVIIGEPVEVHAVYKYHEEHWKTRVSVDGKNVGHMCQICHIRKTQMAA